jgi:3-hydroxyacyl-CoA dehydrogenase
MRAFPSLFKDTDPAALDRGLATIRSNYENSVKRGRFSQKVAEERLKRITPTLSYDDFSKVDLVIEAIFEGMALKKEVFRELDRVCKAGAILASNTSTLSIDEIASATSRPEFVVGTHFFSPANVVRLLEIVRGKNTSKEVIATCMQLSKKLGKVGVLVGNCRGFVGNRMFGSYRREAQFLVEEGAGNSAVDQALSDFGMAMGPLATGDLAGLDVGWRIRKEHRHLETPFVSRSSKTGLMNSGDTGKKQERAGTNMMSSAARCQIPKCMNWFESGSRKRALRSDKSPPRKSPTVASMPWSTKARAHPAGGLRPARPGHRHYLSEWLRLPRSSRRPEVVCGHRRPQTGPTSESPNSIASTEKSGGPPRYFRGFRQGRRSGGVGILPLD